MDDYPAYQETFNVNPSADVQFNNIQYLYIGKNESMQEGFLVLSGSCRVIIERYERTLGQWDFVHCPPGTDHS